VARPPQGIVRLPYTLCMLCFLAWGCSLLRTSDTAGPVTVEQLGLSIDGNSFVPYYVQIVDQVRQLINTKKLSQGQTFCSEGDIASALSISKMPVRQAFQKLKSEGLLIIAKGKRPVVGSGRVPWSNCAASAKRCADAAWSHRHGCSA